MTRLELGSFGTSILTVDQQATLNLTSDIHAGHNNDGIAILTVRDAGTVVSADDIFLGEGGGEATLIVENGAATSSNRMILGGQNGNQPEPGVGIASYSGAGTTGLHETVVLGDLDDSYGELTISGGALFEVKEALELANSPGSIALITVDGQGSVLEVSPEEDDGLFLGGDYLPAGIPGTSELLLTNGANVFIGDDQLPLAGNVIMVSSFQGGNGTVLSVKDGSTITGLDYLHIGFSPGSDGEVVFEGSGTNCFINEALNVGVLGEGSLKIEEGAAVDVPAVYYGNVVRWSGTVDGPGSLLRTDSVTFGSEASTSMSIKDGGTVSCRNEFEISEDALVFVSSAFVDAGLLLVDGELKLDSSECTAPVEVSDTGLLYASSGNSSVFGDVTLLNGEIDVPEVSELEIRGNFSGNGTFSGTGLVRFYGDVDFGQTPQAVQFDGTIISGLGSNVSFKIGGANPNQYDRLRVGTFSTGTLDLGSFRISLVDGFIPSQGQQFLIITTDDLPFSRWNGLSEGDLVGTYEGVDLFITFEAGDGNDVAVYTQGTAMSRRCCSNPMMKSTTHGLPIARPPMKAHS